MNSTTSPLSVEIEDGALVIRIGVETLASAIETSPDQRFNDVDEEGEFVLTKVSDLAVFAQEVVSELNAEQEDGTTPVHMLLENAVFNAVENGSRSVFIPSQIEDAPAGRRAYKCEQCEVRDIQYIGPCPYGSEINNDHNYVKLCNECARKRAEDV